jgi:hypothetical protein
MGSEQSRSRSRSRSRSSHTSSHTSSRTWSRDAPKSVGERSEVLAKCGRKCFLGPDKSFPVCARLGTGTGSGTCRIDRRGVVAAYSRAREWASITARKKRSSGNARRHRTYTKVARRAKTMLSRMKK